MPAAITSRRVLFMQKKTKTKTNKNIKTNDSPQTTSDATDDEDRTRPVLRLVK
jgi:hypothetical protein